ncbi:MAG: DUF5662 family protein [Christensenellales bacterium]
MNLRNLLRHFLTITRHRHLVIAHCRRAGILRQGLFHDLSKYHPAEFLSGARHFSGTRSPNDVEREVYGYSRTWLRHKGRNKHHFEYWMDYRLDTGRMGAVKMPFRYVVEMFCDRVAASKIYMGDRYTCTCPLRYFERGISSRMIHPETADFIQSLLTMLCERGEAETFRYIKALVRSKGEY